MAAVTLSHPSPCTSPQDRYRLSPRHPSPTTPIPPISPSSNILPKPSLCFPSSLSRKSSFAVSSQNPISDLISSSKRCPDSQFDDSDKPREECGVFGIFGDPEASRLCYLSLHALQHRGQEGAGIVSVNDGVLQSITGVGLVSDVFNQAKLDQLPGDSAIGHVRYSTAGSSMLKNVQQFVASYRFRSMGVAHNGNLVNYKSLRAELEDNGSIFKPGSDTSLIGKNL